VAPAEADCYQNYDAEALLYPGRKQTGLDAGLKASSTQYRFFSSL
jgi:hypothetical protein